MIRAKPLDRRALLRVGAIGAGSCLAAGASAQQLALTGPVEIDVRAHPIAHFKVDDSALTRFGECQFRGGLELSSRHEAFGGLSGIAMNADGGGFLAITDVGNWFRAKIVYDKDRPTALGECVLAPMLSSEGAPLKRTRWYDTESLCLDRGVAYVSIERVHDVMRFDWGKDGFKARGRIVPTTPGLKSLPANRGCEAIGVAPTGSPIAGALVAISERSGDGSQPTRGFIFTGAQRGEFSVALKEEFDITDLAFLPGGDILLLERFYRPFRGVALRIRRVDGKSLWPGAILDGATVLEADLACQIDNMEALGVHVTRGGEIVLTMLSDDNFSIMQRTLLLQFTLLS
ncbi:MAG: esterase-like activity of phytase family protein [Beijerinckiaceae bacterium]